MNRDELALAQASVKARIAAEKAQKRRSPEKHRKALNEFEKLWRPQRDLNPFGPRDAATLFAAIRGAEKAQDDSDCWIWAGVLDRYGYGRPWWNGKQIGAHRLAWIAANGPIQDGLHVLHSCDRPACVNPYHLRLGTHAENLRDRDSKGRNVVPVRAQGRWTGRVKRVG